MNDETNKRKHERKGVAIPLVLERWVVVQGRSTNVPFSVQGMDVGSGGIGIASSQPLTVGDVVKVAYPINDSGTVLPVYSEVVWTRMAGETARAGLRFLL